MAQQEEPYYRLTDDNLKIVNVAIKGYTRKVTSSWPKEEYYAYKIIALTKYVVESSSVEEKADRLKEGDKPEADKPTEDKPEGDQLEGVKPDAEGTGEDTKDSSVGGSKKNGGNQHRWEMWRRYSEFELLRNFLQAVYPHAVIPPLPEKRFQGNASLLNKITTGEDFGFLSRRAQSLETFLLRVSRHPILSKNKWFHEFLYMNGWKESIGHSGYKEAESPFRSFSFSYSPKVADSRFVDVKSYSNELETVVAALLQIRETVNNKLKAVHKIHSDYAKTYTELSDSETTLGASMQAAAGNMDAYADLIDVYLEEEELRYHLPLKEYQNYCESLRGVVRRQEMLQCKVEKSENLLFSKAEEKDNLQKRDPGSGSGFSLRVLGTKLRGGDSSYNGIMEQVDSELKEADSQLKQNQQQLDEFVAESMAELARFNTQKVSDFRSMLINYVQLQMHLHRQGMNIWERLRQAFETSSLRLT
ncbi:sorting nexin-4-like isoform X2 [Dysidea avara]|uniref:sorting nexin-4-like isoform X2 n=1 Tax=Dysidea avara TaxID=196820 RepID=UPI003332EC47